MELQSDFIAHPGHLVRSDFNFSVLGCIPAMVTGNAAAASDDLVGAFCGAFGGDDAAVERATGWTFHGKWEKDGTGLKHQSGTDLRGVHPRNR